MIGNGVLFQFFHWHSRNDGSLWDELAASATPLCHAPSTDCNADAPEDYRIYLLNGKTFSDEVSAEFGNFDHLMGGDVDVYNPAVREELFYWGRWFVDTTQVDGFRLDAVKHIRRASTATSSIISGPTSAVASCSASASTGRPKWPSCKDISGRRRA